MGETRACFAVSVTPTAGRFHGHEDGDEDDEDDKDAEDDEDDKDAEDDEDDEDMAVIMQSKCRVAARDFVEGRGFRGVLPLRGRDG